MASCDTGQQVVASVLKHLQRLQSSGGNCRIAPALHHHCAITAPSLCQDGWAVQLINWGKSTQTVVCDASCMMKMGWKPAQRVSIRDLWTLTSNGTASILSYQIPGGGASVLVKITAADSKKREDQCIPEFYDCNDPSQKNKCCPGLVCREVGSPMGNHECSQPR